MKTEIREVEPEVVWQDVRSGEMAAVIIDVREPREYHRGHIPNAELVPLPQILFGNYELKPDTTKVIFVCRSGRRSRRAAQKLMNGQSQIEIVKGGMIAWEAAGLLEAIK